MTSLLPRFTAALTVNARNAAGDWAAQRKPGGRRNSMVNLLCLTTALSRAREAARDGAERKRR